MTDTEVARWIADHESDIISYLDFDHKIGIGNVPESQDKNLKRFQVMKRINTILKCGIVIGDQILSLEMIVQKKGEYFRRAKLVESAKMSIENSITKIASVVDRANKKASYTLGQKGYRSVDGSHHQFRKIAPEVPEDSESRELISAHRQLNHDIRILRAMAENIRESVETIELISTSASRALPKRQRLLEQTSMIA